MDQGKVKRPVDEASPRAGSRSARLQSRRRRREEDAGRFFTLAALGTLIPGLGLLAAGRRGWGKFILTLVGLGLAAAALVLILVPLDQLATGAFDRSQMAIVAIGLGALAIAWLTVAVSSLKALDSGRLPTGKRFAGAFIVMALASLVVAPMSVGARYAWTQANLIDSISQDSATTPDLAADDPWKDKPRVNVLLLGGDAGEGREGLRPDSLILASIDTESGDTVMLSLPRNLERVPFATGTPAGDALAAQFPDGFTNYVPTDANFHLNAVYRNAPDYVSEEVFAGSDDPGADATKLAVAGALGIDVDYYVLVDLQGFKDVVDAMGGITIDVNYPIPIASKKLEGANAGCSQPRGWIMPGQDQQLDGDQALWFARARCSPGYPGFDYTAIGGDPVKDDWNRMERQRCVMGALAQRANPIELLPSFESLAAATEKNIRTDIPSNLFRAFADLGLEIKKATMTSLAFTNEVIPDRTSPDFAHIHTLVQEALDRPPDINESIEASTDAGSSDDETTEESSGSESADESTESSESTTESNPDETAQSTDESDPEEPVDVTSGC